MSTVRNLLQEKHRKAGNISVTVDNTVLDALKVMAEANIGAVLVSEDHKFVGIFTERDYLLKGELAGRTAKSTRVGEVMTASMYTVHLDTSAEQCMALMDEHHIRHLPVVEKDQIVGMVSIRDVLAAVLDNKESEIKGLENYIMGTGFSG